ncbi:peptidase inhibitor family I36 protein [Streptomyces sp. G-G2]|uniref:peptidase inhibitor family I36 protein n=1 Tax=Streptomyces sp. G-G2 TaxID=3046201 RepID=UPI0024BA54C1|nr:peptidase inhibitor family I36 protein [Streptomyces sp. G-G2]MDJ0386343.1 peptidase inhibitor family I36 protein [Streptomyces sp. G-G2]
MQIRVVSSITATLTATALLIAVAPTASAASNLPKDPPANPVLAEYKGKKINLAASWSGATVCTEFPGGSVHCYSNDTEAQADPELRKTSKLSAPMGIESLPGNCSPDYWCLFEDINYGGHKLQFFDSGRKNLSDWGFRDTASSIYRGVINYPLNYGYATMVDYRSGVLYDRVRDVGQGLESKYPSLGALGYPDGGDWNDRMDAFDVKRG